jgi:outer membrane receptor protein involved in Fe transport
LKETDLKKFVCVRASVETQPLEMNFMALAVRKAMASQSGMLAAAVPVLLAISAASVWAQVPAPAAASAPAAADAPLALQEVTVTATRRAGSLQQVPGTVQSISASTLSDLGIQAVSDGDRR